MAETKFRAAYYRRRAAQMRELADRAETETLREMYTRLADNWLERADGEDMVLDERGEE